MALIDLLKEIDSEIKLIKQHTIEVTTATTVPAIDDPNITHDNFDTKTKKCKTLETCVLYVDLRKSTEISNSLSSQHLAKMYSAYIRSMIKAAQHFGGYIRNIIGDRVMVLFDPKDCFLNSVNTAFLLNTVAHYIFAKHFLIKDIEIKCGIGVDYGKMLVTKTGVVKQGKENAPNKSIVWLGKPANIASKLTDNANQKKFWSIPGVSKGLYYPLTDNWSWIDMRNEDFLNELQTTHSPQLIHKDSYFNSFFQTRLARSNTTKPILITKEVHSGLKKNAPNEKSIKEHWWRQQNVDISEYKGTVYGCSGYYTDVENI